MWDLYCGMWTLSCGMWHLVPWPGIKLRPPAFGLQKPSHWITCKVPQCHCFKWVFYTLLSMKLNTLWAHCLWQETGLFTAAAKSRQSCPTLWDPINGSPPGSSVPGILQARTLEWVAISFSNAWKWKVKVKSLNHARLLATPWTIAYQAPPSMGFSRQEYWIGLPLPPPWILSYHSYFLSL